MFFQYKRSHTCGELTERDSGLEVHLCGWVHHRRDHGGLIFIDLRDRYGTTQVVLDPQTSKQVHEIGSWLRSEWVIYVQGKVRKRQSDMTNNKLSTGSIEIEATNLHVLSKSLTPPFQLHDEIIHPNEELRLTYRYLDMRQAPIHKRLVMRHRVCQITREHFNNSGFLEIHTPYLGKSTPEGARDYLVPSRIYPGKFYALPQSPQLFKQLLMVGGMDRYYQICPCFRDEDLRADRQPEFYQIDVEMSFAHTHDLFNQIEELFSKLFKEIYNSSLITPFRRMSYKEAMDKYGCDKPDLRFGMTLSRVDDLLATSSFDLAKQEIELGAISKAMCIPGGGSKLSRKNIEALISFAQNFGLGGLAWLKRSKEEEGSSSGYIGPLARFFDALTLEKLKQRLDMQEDDLLIIGFANEKTLNQAMDQLRRHVAKQLNLIDSSRFEFVWIVDFPLFQKDSATGKIVSEHHPFTSPLPEDFDLLESDPIKVRGNCYDLVLNGYEIASGSQRIHDQMLQRKIFEILDLSHDDIEKRFGFFVKALQYGAPPHLGCALGLDRIVMILSETDNIRDVMAFPKTQNAADLMTEAPSYVNPEQLDELGLEINI